MLRFGESIGVDLVALSFVRTADDISTRAQAHATAADRQDREAPGGRRRRGDHPRRRLRDGRARGPRDRAADRGRADGPEAAAADRRTARAPVDHRDPDARLDGRLPAARPGPRRPMSPTRSSTAPTRSCSRRRPRSAPIPVESDRDDGLDRRADRARRSRTGPGTRSASVVTRVTPPTPSPTAPAPRLATCTWPRSSCRPCPGARRG